MCKKFMGDIMLNIARWVFRICRKSTKSPKFLVIIGILLLSFGYWLFNLKVSSDAVVSLDIQNAKELLDIRDKNNYQVSELQNDDVKPYWHFSYRNVGVYAIQGRRAEMEDRFNVVVELQQSNTSLYGIFDGHGGQVFLITSMCQYIIILSLYLFVFFNFSIFI